MFSRNDHVTTKMGKLPPSPCHACGSSNHWDKECPDWEVYRAQVASTKRTARNIEKEPEMEESDKLYQSTYSILLPQRLASTQIDLNRLSPDFKSAVRLSNVTALSVEGAISERKTGESRQVDIEEIVDEAVEMANAMKTSLKYLLIHESEAHEEEPLPAIKHPAQTPRKATPVSVEEVEDDFWDKYRTKLQSTSHILEENLLATEEANEPTRTVHTSVTETSCTAKSSEHPETSIPLPPPPKEIKPVRMPKKRFYPAGESSVGVSVLSVKGWVGHLDNSQTDLRLDSCANVTLISEEYYSSLKAKPLIQQGMQMRLWQLTDTNSSLKGFVQIPVFMLSEDGTTVEMEAEAYIVPGMTVPILLGEDYQLTYEVGVARNVEEGPRVHFRKSDYGFTAQQVERTKDFERLCQSAYSIGKFIRSKLHRRRKNKRHRQKVKFGRDEKVVRAAEDYKGHMSASVYELKDNWARTETGSSVKICSQGLTTLTSSFRIL